ncbi:MAG: STAS domain-containing protein [Planctomycetes bacterium]|nr:STAS domain-containing protein [Planctomycetota bacterium]
MKIDRQEIGTVHVLVPQGALVDDDAGEFADVLEKMLTPGDSPGANVRLVLSLSEVPYLDSRALEALLDCSDALRARSAPLKLAAVSPTCREIMQLTGLADRFQFFEQVQDAVRSFL